MNVKLIFCSMAIAALAGCSTPATYVDTENDQTVVMGLDYKDFEKAANKAVEDISSNPTLVHPDAINGGRYVLAVNTIVNDTTQRIDTDQLSKKIRVGLLQSGRFLTTTAVSSDGMEDDMTSKVRELEKSEIVDKNSAKKTAGVILPDFSLSGKIIQRNHSVDSSTQQIDYYIQLTMTNVENGLAYWEGEYPIIKRGSSKSVNW